MPIPGSKTPSLCKKFDASAMPFAFLMKMNRFQLPYSEKLQEIRHLGLSHFENPDPDHEILKLLNSFELGHSMVLHDPPFKTGDGNV
jgi:hypothetical protein